MSGSPVATCGELRARILLDPDLILGDPAVMRALVERTDRARRGEDGKVVDLRSVAMARLEARLGRLEASHRTVIAAAYENLAGTQQVHRAILRLLDARSLEGFVEGLSGEVAAILRLDAVRLVAESAGGRWPEAGDEAGPQAGQHPGPESGPVAGPAAGGPPPQRPAASARDGAGLAAANDARPPSAPGAARGVIPGAASGAASGPAPGAARGLASCAGLKVVPPGWVTGRVACGAGVSRVILRRGAVLLAEGGGEGAVPVGSIGSEAWLALDLGPGRRPCLVVLGSGDPDQFAPGQGTELLEFLAGVLERALRRWLA